MPVQMEENQYWTDGYQNDWLAQVVRSNSNRIKCIVMTPSKNNSKETISRNEDPVFFWVWVANTANGKHAQKYGKLFYKKEAVNCLGCFGYP